MSTNLTGIVPFANWLTATSEPRARTASSELPLGLSGDEIIAGARSWVVVDVLMGVSPSRGASADATRGLENRKTPRNSWVDSPISTARQRTRFQQPGSPLQRKRAGGSARRFASTWRRGAGGRCARRFIGFVREVDGACRLERTDVSGLATRDLAGSARSTPSTPDSNQLRAR